MERSIPIPVWLLLLLFLLWGVATVTFGWAVRSKLTGDAQSGYLGDVAVEIASFPSLAAEVVLEVIGYSTGDYKDAAVIVSREADADYAGFAPISAAPGIDVEGPLVKVNPAEALSGWRLVSGAFVVDGDMENAALLLSPGPEPRIVKRWILDEIPVGDFKPQPKHLKFVHGVEMLGDGSLIFTFDGSVSLQRIDSCGDRQWTTGGVFHHSVTLDESGETVWTFSDFAVIAQVAVDDGAVLRRISMDDIIAANPGTDLLEIRRSHPNDLHVNSRNTEGEWLTDPFHLNDVEPLPSAIADRLPGFEAGDLLVSVRSLNLLFVLDPNTLRIKWWRTGATQRQHDPDWLPSGEILVLNNRMSRDYSEIVAMDPLSLARTVRFDGRKNNFYTRIRGKHQMLDGGYQVISSPQQGRAFEVDGRGDVVFEIVNPKPGSDNENYVVSELRWIPTQALDVENWRCPPAH